jgi:TolB-like protein/tetratricopeptide (TPR) repeat protein
MPIWSAEIKELESLYTSVKGRFPELEKDLGHLIKTYDENVALLYSRRCLEIIITDLCECELKRPRKTEPLKGIIDKLYREQLVPSNIIVSMQNLNSLSTLGTHPKEFDPEQVKPALNNLTTIIKWYLKFNETRTISKIQSEEARHDITEKVNKSDSNRKFKKRLILILSGLLLIAAIVIVALFVLNIMGDKKKGENLADLEKSIAVLPFENMSESEEYSYFGDAMTDEIIMQLCKINEFNVRSRTSVLQYKATEKTSPVIGRELKVNYLIEGSAQRFEDQVRIRVQLIHAPTDNHLWGEVFEGNWKDILSVQSRIAKQIAGELQTVLTPEETRQIDKEKTKNPEAYDFYLRGNDYNNRSYAQQDFNMAIRMYQKAIELDPDFALAYTRLAMTHLNLYWHHHDRSEESLMKSKQAIDAAFKLEPGLTEAFIALGDYYYSGLLDYPEALKQFEIALSQSPKNAETVLYIACVHRRAGNWEKSLESFEKAIELDPQSSLIAFNAGENYELLREYSEAVRYYDIAIMLNPDWYNPYYQKSSLYVKWKQDIQQARAVLKEANQVITSSVDKVLLTYVSILLELYDRNYEEALRYLSLEKSEAFQNQFYFIPRYQYFALIYGLMDNSKLKYAYYDSCRLMVQDKLITAPDDSRLYSALGIAYAGLGMKKEAIEAGEKAVELLPVSKEAFRGTNRVEDLARIYVMTGEYEKALEQIKLLLSIPGMLSANLLRLDPVWEPLANNPEFIKLLETYSEN